MNHTSISGNCNKWLQSPDGDCCEHLEENAADPRPAYTVLCEDDSFGPVARTVVCRECFLEAEEEEREYIETCVDCRKKFPRKEMIEWRPWDYYPPADITESWVCKECSEKDRHIQREARDKKERLAWDEEQEERREEATAGGW